jgi:1-deoxy-D-xylulose-5-phosphate synthase
LTDRFKLVDLFHQSGGCSAFTNTQESSHDHFNVRHTSTSVSLAVGYAKGRDAIENPRSSNYKVVSVIASKKATIIAFGSPKALSCAEPSGECSA